MLNSMPLKPEMPDEIELMLSSVMKAEKTRGRGTVWDRAEDLYREAFIRNCAADEEDRLYIRAPATSEMLRAAFEGMAARRRADNVEQASSSAAPVCEQPSASPSVPREPHAGVAESETVVEHASTPASVVDAAAEVVSKSETQPKSKPARAVRQKWKQRIADGMRLSVEQVPDLGCKPLSEFLRAMGVKVSSLANNDRDELQTLANQELMRRGVRSWSVHDG